MILPVPAYTITWTFDFDPDTGSGVPGAPQYAFGVNVAAHSFWFKQGVGATDWIKIGSGAAAGPVVTCFTYTVTGSEPDLSEVTVALPAARPDANYSVFPQTQGAPSIVACDVHGRTATQFVLSTTGNLTAGDVIGFLVVQNS